MEIRARCAKHNQILEIFSTYKSDDTVTIDVVPCPQCHPRDSVFYSLAEPTFSTFVPKIIEKEVLDED